MRKSVRRLAPVAAMALMPMCANATSAGVGTRCWICRISASCRAYTVPQSGLAEAPRLSASRSPLLLRSTRSTAKSLVGGLGGEVRSQPRTGRRAGVDADGGHDDSGADGERGAMRRRPIVECVCQRLPAAALSLELVVRCGRRRLRMQPRLALGPRAQQLPVVVCIRSALTSCLREA